VSDTFDGYPADIRARLLALRDLIYDVAAETDGVGQLEETLKWGQISYRTPATKSGTTIRIDAIPGQPEQIGMFVHCQTTLVDTYRTLYGDTLAFDGDRCVRIDARGELPEDAVRHCIQLALTYHLRKKKRSR
jgi:hypothetical protein